MKHAHLVSVIQSHKKQNPITTHSDSFFQVNEPVSPYIEPRLTKEAGAFEAERPAILLVSAVAASGKTTMARSISHATGLPILDLARHKAVGDNTLTGVLTTAYPAMHVGDVLQGIADGTHGVIIDGIDEGRSKTTTQGFEAFLDNLISLAGQSPSTSIVVFGRSQALVDAWVYLAEKECAVGLVRIDPFDLDQARSYIDAYAAPSQPALRLEYERSRDHLLNSLNAAFSSTTTEQDDDFLSFIGYPPVLDSIATLLIEEPNYYGLNQAIAADNGQSLEVQMLVSISRYLLERERNEKAVPNFINKITEDAPPELAEGLKKSLYNSDEQCARVLARALHKPFPLQVIQDKALSAKYESSLKTWCPEHPFLSESRLRNAVFEAVAISSCILSELPEYKNVAAEYLADRRPSYHLLYITSEVASGRMIDPLFYNALIQSGSDFADRDHEVSAVVSGLSWDEPDLPDRSLVDLDVEVRSLKSGDRPQRCFSFSGNLDHSQEVVLGPVIRNVSATLPGHVVIRGKPTVLCSGACTISAATVEFDSQDVILRPAPYGTSSHDQGLCVDARRLIGHTEAADARGVVIELVNEESSLSYPLAKYTRKSAKEAAPPELKEKYRRLRRILSEFASHSKGGLAKYRAKIEHERVLRGPIGQNVLEQLLKEGVLYADAKFYYVDSIKRAAVLDTTWIALRQYEISDRLKAFLSRVP